MKEEKLLRWHPIYSHILWQILFCVLSFLVAAATSDAVFFWCFTIIGWLFAFRAVLAVVFVVGINIVVARDLREQSYDD